MTSNSSVSKPGAHRSSGHRKRTSRTDAVGILDVLRDRIARHQLPPGAKLRETALSDEFGVSRARVREVLGALEQRGLIERIPNRGAIVLRLTLKQALNVFHVREMLEALAIRAATDLAPKGTWDDLVTRFDDPDLEAELGAGQFQRYIEAQEHLRELMIKHCDNELLAELLENIEDKSRVLSRRVLILPQRWQTGIKYHRLMVRAMACGDSAEAERVKRKIISSACDALEEYQEFVF